VKLLLPILFLIVSCNFKTIDAIQTREVWVEYIKPIEISRIENGKYKTITFHIYEDAEGTQYRVQTYEGLIMKIHIPSRTNL
jgi:hypothetical protein